MNIIFIFNEFSLHNHIIETYCSERSADRISIVKVPLVLKGKSRSESANRILPQLSKRFVWSKFKEFLVVSLITLLPKFLGRGATFKRLRSIASKKQIPFHKSGDVMSKETLTFIQRQNPDLIITLFHQIIKPELIKIPRLGVINIHPGILPEFRGIQPYFWELMEGFGKAGATLHYIEDATVDTGKLLGQVSYKTTDSMSVQLNYFLTAKAAGFLLPQVITALESGKVKPLPQDPKAGNYYRWPDSVAVSRLLERGHKIVSLSDLTGILTGKFDRFNPLEVEIY